MKPTNVFRKTERTEDQRRELAEIRERFQQEKPSREALLAQGDLVECGTLGEFLDCIAAAANLRTLRESAGLSIAAVAQQIGAEQQTVADIETGQWGGNVALDTLYRYARAVGAELQFVIRKTSPVAKG